MTNEKELLRITDEETGYDLVAVQNPHGDFWYFHFRRKRRWT